MGLAPESIRSVTVAALSCADADAQACQTALGAAEKFLSRQYPCRGFCSAGRIVLLLTSENGFLQLHAAIDELRRALKRLLDLDVSAGISKEHAPDADFHEAYKEAMRALKTAGDGKRLLRGPTGRAALTQPCGRVLQNHRQGIYGSRR